MKVEQLYPNTSISFFYEDYPLDMAKPHEDALVITTQVGLVDMHRIMIDNGSSVDVLYSYTYQRIDLKSRERYLCQESRLYEFSNDPVHVTGIIELSIVFGTTPRLIQIMVIFFVL